MAKILIAYFSHAGENYVGGTLRSIEHGNTEIIANKLRAQLPSADLFHIETVTPYPEDYRQCVAVAEREYNESARPQLKGKVENMDQYDTLVLGFPCWHGTMPMACFTFLSSYNLRGKTIIPFCTNEGSGMGRSEADIKRLCRGSKIKEGTSINGSNVNSADAEVDSIAYMAR
ncbi:MAG: flavodoxin [Bacteroidales bacterium]|nr:flavodoxin [Bacteroidales bacterium]